MTDDLRTRIAAVLKAYWPGECSDTDADESPIDHLADAVIRELGLRREDGLTSDGSRVVISGTTFPANTHRYVTEWTADE